MDHWDTAEMENVISVRQQVNFVWVSEGVPMSIETYGLRLCEVTSRTSESQNRNSLMLSQLIGW